MLTNSTLMCIRRDPGQLGLLKEHGYELATATNGSDGLRLFMSRPVDAVVIEHHLCLVEGAAIADQIKEARPDVPVVMLADQVGLPANALKSVDALVVESDGPYFLLGNRALHSECKAGPAPRSSGPKHRRVHCVPTPEEKSLGGQAEYPYLADEKNAPGQ